MFNTCWLSSGYICLDKYHEHPMNVNNVCNGNVHM